jgi:hypothetical protein
MQSLHDFIIKPVGDNRYNNSKKIAGVDFVTNTRIEAFQNVNREAVVVALPKCVETNIQVGDKVIVHHNVFRRFYDIRGKEKDSKSYMFDGMYAVTQDQIYMKKTTDSWQTLRDYCFIKPIINKDSSKIDKLKKCVGIIKYSNSSLEDLKMNVEDLIGFKANGEVEILILC